MPKNKKPNPKQSPPHEPHLELDAAEDLQTGCSQEEQAQATFQHLADRRLAIGLAMDASADLDRQDIAHLSSVMHSDPDWIAFSSADARWINFTADMKSVFASWDIGSYEGSLTLGEAWVDDVTQVMSTWISQQIIETASRAAHFRSLGRGWIWIQLSSAGSRFNNKRELLQEQRTRFKWWFENLDRVLRNRKQELRQLHFIGSDVKGEKLEKYTTGYMPLSEFVFVLRGLCPTLHGPVTPNIGIQKWCSDFKNLDRWAPTEDIRAAVAKPIATDEERHQHAMNVQRQKERRKRQKERQKLKKQQEKEDQEGQDREVDADMPDPDIDLVLSAPEKMQQSNAEFEDLLASLKLEVGTKHKLG